MKAIKNIIFDLGGVLIHLGLDKTEAAFCALMGGKEGYAKAAKSLKESGLFERLEVNAVSEIAFMETIRAASPQAISLAQIEAAWNAMLLTVPADGLRLLEELRAAGYRLYLVSNTNSIHIRRIRKIVEAEHGIRDFDGLFEKAYYSHLLELRKPDIAIFQYVLDDAQLVAEETLFIDDNRPNLEGANAVGIQTFFLEANGDVYGGLKAFLEL